MSLSKMIMTLLLLFFSVSCAKKAEEKKATTEGSPLPTIEVRCGDNSCI